MKAAIVFTTLMAIIFLLAYSSLALAVSYIMRDYQEPAKTGFTSLEVKTNDGGVQHRQVYVEQPAKNVQEQ